MPLVAVLMPVRNAERFVSRAVQSVLAQDMSDFEVVVVDDGSTDRTVDQVLGVADGRVRIVKGPADGVARALGAGLATVDAEYVCRMDADDLCLPGRLRVQAQHLRARPRCGMVGGHLRTISASGAPLVTLNPRLPRDADACRLHLAMANCFVHPAVMMRLASVVECGGYDPSVRFEDYDLWLRIARSWDVENVPDRVVAYRYHASNTYRVRRTDAAQQLAPRLRDYCRQELEMAVEIAALEVLLDPAAGHARTARLAALVHLEAVLRRADGLSDRQALVHRARQLALQVAAPSWRRRRPLLPPGAWSAAPRAAAAALSRRLVL